MRKPKESVKLQTLWDRADLNRSCPELQLQPVCVDPPRWSERAKLQDQWRALKSIDRPRTLH
jgi:hypothetical protein